MSRKPVVRFLPTGTDGDGERLARAELTIDRKGDRPPLRIVAEASDRHVGPRVRVSAGDEREWAAGLAWAALRWSPGEGPPDLTLGWPGQPNHGTATYAMVSDALALASNGDAQWAVRALWDALPTTGRPAGLTTIADDEQLRQPIREMRRDHVKVTQPAVASRSGVTVSEIRGYLTATGRSWSEFLASF